MAKFKTPRSKKAGRVSSQPPRAGWPCVIIVILGVIGIFVFLILVMKYAS